MDDQDLMADAWAEALGEQSAAEIKPAELEEFSSDSPISAEERRKLDAILDIPVTITMEVGRSQITLRIDYQLFSGSLDDDGVWPSDFLCELVNRGSIGQCALVHDDLVRAEDVQRLGCALVDVVLDVTNWADHAVWQIVPVTAVAPYRRKAETVVTVRTWAFP